MKNSIKLFLLCSTILVLSVLPATAQLATLAWDQNTQPEVVGYRVYYQVDTPTFPFNGTTLTEGVSPIIVDYLFQKFMRAAVGTNNVDSVARFGHLPAMEALRKAFGTAAPTDSMADIAKSDLIFALDANITEDANILGLKVLKRQAFHLDYLQLLILNLSKI